VDSRTPNASHDLALLVLRLGAGALLLGGHGWGKLTHFSEYAANFANPIGLGSAVSFTLVVFAETLCSLLVMLGLATRLATIPILIFFAVATFIQHAHDPWPRRELPLLYAVPFVALALTGGGRYSLDALLARARRGR
jgi:putative oxidoreductase